MQASQKFVNLAYYCRYPTKQLSPFNIYSTTFLLSLPSVACLSYFQSTLFSFQGASLPVSPFVETRFKHSTLWTLESVLNEYSLGRMIRYGSSLCLLSLARERRWWAKVDSNHRPHDYQSCALASWAIGPSWWRLPDSNRWPPACKAGALPAELNPQTTCAL